MFNLNFKIELSDLLLILGIALLTIGLYLIYIPASIIFLGTACIVLAFLMSPKKARGGGD
ncbi:hypothetical protein DEAC_c40220 [Desulfosporosinus acididurans]|uniref:Uncharacterized protein n=1 Tax=Desulfosporosinus acididurans TaxID=476652 RepID=A0A0J1FM58_9FIRM|nr:hypothetical protein [Desulfosporosinus acididurans]KLU64028.1 hypothetical protein DEAC_c40220 [Desulfosporosinus acididurans]